MLLALVHDQDARSEEYRIRDVVMFRYGGCEIWDICSLD